MNRSDNDLSWPRWLLAMLATAAAAIAMVAAANTFIDPLDLFGGPRVAGLNERKPYLDHHRELARWRRAERLCATAGIFGNSRAEIGLDPGHEAFTRVGASAFDHAIPGTGPATTWRQLSWLGAVGCAPSLRIIGVDFFDFLGGSAGDALAGGVPIPAIDRQVLAEVVFSLSGLGDSLATMAMQRAATPPILTARGFNPLLEYGPEVARSGHHVLFRQRAEENARVWQRRAPRLATTDGLPSGDQKALAAILDDGAATAATTKLVIYPYHAEIRLMMASLGLADLYDAWRRDLAAQVSARAARGERVELWDFSQPEARTREPIPARGDRDTRLRYYWEAGHFKKALGDEVLERVLLGRGDFGERIDATNIEAHLARDRAALEAVRREDTALVAEVDDVLKHARH